MIGNLTSKETVMKFALSTVAAVLACGMASAQSVVVEFKDLSPAKQAELLKAGVTGFRAEIQPAVPPPVATGQLPSSSAPVYLLLPSVVQQAVYSQPLLPYTPLPNVQQFIGRPVYAPQSCPNGRCPIQR